MTSLRALLDGPAEAGIYRLGADTDLDAVRQLAADAGWRIVEVDCAEIDTRDAVYAALQDAFGFAEWFGANLDALADALTDVNDEPGTVVVFTRWDPFADAEPEYWQRLLRVLAERAGDGDTPGRLLTLLQ